MKITMDIDEETFNVINNAVIAGLDIYSALLFHCSVPQKFEKLKDLTEEQLDNKRKKLINFYASLEKEFLQKE